MAERSVAPISEKLTRLVAAAGIADDFADAVCTAIGASQQLQTDGTSPFDQCVLRAKEGVSLLAQFHLDAADLEQAFSVVKDIAQTCKPNKTCEAITLVASGSEAVVKDVQAKNYGGAVGAVFGTVQDLSCPPGDSNKPGCSDEEQKVYTFLRALSVYSIDSISSGNTGSSDDADFRKAAVELIESVSGAGVRRRLLTHVQFLYVPEFALRDAWRPGHIGRGSSPLFVYPSVDLLRGRKVFPVRKTFYVGLHASLLDAIGPFIEISTRAQGLGNDPKRAGVFALAFVVPRLELELGIPELTRNLVVGFGGGLRFFRAENLAEGPRYCVIGTACKGGGGRGLTWDNVELSVFAKFVP